MNWLKRWMQAVAQWNAVNGDPYGICRRCVILSANDGSNASRQFSLEGKPQYKKR